MNKLELIKQATVDYVDLDVFNVGEIYYIVDISENRSLIAICLSISKEKAIFKVMNYLTGIWDPITSNHDQFNIDTTNPRLTAYLHIFPVTLNYMIDPCNMKITIKSEIKMY